MRRLVLFAALAWGCEVEPTSARVTLEIEEPGVDSLRLQLRRVDQVQPVVDCAIGAGALAGRCPFEDPREAWEPGEPLTFVVFGEVDAEIEIAAEGLDRLGEVVTSTRGTRFVSDTDARPLVLRARTEPRGSCSIDIPQDVPVSEGTRDRTALIPYDLDGDGALELIVGTPRRISVVQWSASDDGGCSLVETGTVSSDCTPRGGHLVVGDLDPAHPGPELAGHCLSRGGNNRNRFSIWGLEREGPSALLRERVIEGAINQITRPVLMDLDGDGWRELTYLVVTSTAGPVVSLASWRAGEPNPRHRVITGLRLSSPTSAMTHSPLVLPLATGRDAAVIGAYRGGVFLVNSDGLYPIEANNSTPPTAFAGALVDRAGAPPRSLFVRDSADGATVFETALESGARTAVRVLAERQRITGLTTIAVAVGDVDGEGAASAVLAADGFIQILPLTSTTAPARRFSVGESIDGAMAVLLADVDGAPGAEVLAFLPKVGRVFAFSGAGRPVRGFPLSIGVPGPETRVALTDLDGDRALELVALSYDRLTVVSLGARTYAPDSTPWPQAFRDSGGRASAVDERDPR